MSEQLDAYLSGLLSHYERLQVYSDALYEGVHPRFIPQQQLPSPPVAIVHFYTKGMTLRGSHEHAVYAIEKMLQRIGERRPSGFEACAFSWFNEGYPMIACVISAENRVRSEYLREVVHGLRRTNLVEGLEHFSFGTALPLEAAFAVWWMEQKLELHDCRISSNSRPFHVRVKRDLRPVVVRMMHELGLRRNQLVRCKSAVLQLSRLAKRSGWLSWEEAERCPFMAELPSTFPNLISMLGIRKLTDGSALEQVARLADVQDLIVAGNLEALATEIRRPVGDGTRPTTGQRYEFYATAYLTRTAHLLARVSEMPEEDGDVDLFDAREIPRDPTAEDDREPALPRQVDLGPEHYGYNIVSNTKDDD